ncbi:DUF6706 family protein [Dysgonomonas sp. 37-18]|uniref:DUF6706 family protein n=1 Tax=Dysgonomonas sp. 37-18 TaxID=1895907 RepID=UPI00092B7A8A|nr:DUF6706 family protein [Dysgonomonas sp. 37-18]OJX63108.1 MAG: hypothetical protein BGO84_14485 [Dysgonomonas sp. 37-18]
MIIKDYITSKFQPYGVNISEADLADLDLMGIDVSLEFSNENRNSVYLGLIRYIIPQLLLRAKSISESGFSVSFDTKDILQYYAWLCKELGIEDELNQKPSVRFL